MGQEAVQIGYDIMNGKKPDNPEILMPSVLITKDNVETSGLVSPALVSTKL